MDVDVLLGTQGPSGGSLTGEMLTTFFVGLAGGLAGLVIGWLGLGSKVVEKKIDAKIEDRRIMWTSLMEKDKLDLVQEIVELAYQARNAARATAQAGTEAERKARLAECAQLAQRFRESIEANRFLLERMGAFDQAHSLKGELLTFRNAGRAGDGDLQQRWEKVDAAFAEFTKARNQWFPTPQDAKRG